MPCKLLKQVLDDGSPLTIMAGRPAAVWSQLGTSKEYRGSLLMESTPFFFREHAVLNEHLS